jgi:Prokaryotic Cytochrome C oxidase subunit IV
MNIISEMANTQRRALITWVVLVVATLASWWLAEGHALGAGNKPLIGALLILTIAFAKIRFVGAEFMELRTAPRALQIIFDLWVVGVWGILIGLYLLFGVQN